MLRAITAVAVACGALVVTAVPAGADPARPTDFESVVESVDPPTDAVDVAIVGGDGFLEMTVQPGHTVVVEGYQSEPYLQFLPDGTVQENVNSPATYLNASRDGDTAPPQELLGDVLPQPEWRTIGSDGHAVWHDHRIHFMGEDPSAVAGLAEGDPVPWTVRFTVDGIPTVASGSYRLLDPPSPLPWLVLAAVVAVAVVAAGRRHAVTVAATAVTVAGVLALGVGAVEYSSIPAGAGATVLGIALPAIALIGGVVGLARRRSPAGVIGVLAGVAAAVGWVLTRMTVLWRAVLPTELAPGLDRAGTALALGLAVGAAVLAVRSGALSPAPPDASGSSPDDTLPEASPS